MIKEGILQQQEGSKNNEKSRNKYTYNNYPPHKLYKSYLLIEVKTVAPSDT